MGGVDPATGRQLYVPEVGRAPRAASASRNPDRLPVSEYLYSAGLETLQRKASVVEAERQAAKEAANAPHTTGERDQSTLLAAYLEV